MSELNTDKQSPAKIKPVKPAKPKAPKARKGDDLNPVWFKPVMFGFMLLGLAWIITFYVSSAQLPIQSIENWNILIGFGIAMIGFLMSTRWK